MYLIIYKRLAASEVRSNGDRVAMAVADSGGPSTHVYGYDDIYPVTDVADPEAFDYLATDTTFNYDDVGNRTSVADDEGTVSYTANELNQYTAVADVNCTYKSLWLFSLRTDEFIHAMP